MADTQWLTRADIDRVLETLSADDLIEATDEGKGKGARIAGLAFHHAAVRVLGPSEEPYTKRVKASDFAYLAAEIGGQMNVDSPLSPGGSGSPNSPEPGA